MERSKILHDVWPYMPAFRAVAEAEHLPTAAAKLHVVPSALSRSVRLLETAMGTELFTRRGRRLVLNSQGRRLLDAVRQGMHAMERVLSSGDGATGDDMFRGELRVGSIGVLTNHVVLPVLLALVKSNSAVVPEMKNVRTREANHHLVLGSLDVAFYYDAVPHEGVYCGKLGALGASIYCGRGHPLFARRRVLEHELREHAFSVPAIGDRNTPMDGWPVHVERKVGFRIELLLTNLDVCLAGQFLTVLPDIVAEPFVRTKQVRKFPFRLIPDIEVFGACREGEEDLPIFREIFETVRSHLENPDRFRTGTSRGHATE